MSDVNAYDPSTWGDEEHARAEARYEPGGDLGPDAPIGRDELAEIGARAVAAARADLLDIDRAALVAQLADLRNLRESARRQMEKARATAEAAEVELGRIVACIEATERELDALTFADDEGAPGAGDEG